MYKTGKKDGKIVKSRFYCFLNCLMGAKQKAPEREGERKNTEFTEN